MNFEIDKETVVVFDLDDTLYKEIDYLRSAYRAISDFLSKETGKDLYEEMIKLYHSGSEVFGNIIASYNIKTKTKEDLLLLYRNHIPDIKLPEYTAAKLDEFRHSGISMGLITNGSSLTQRNKLKSLGICDYFDKILISEEFGVPKPGKRIFIYMQKQLRGDHYVYIGDNIKKDFIAPNSLGWNTICLLDDGSNIHAQEYVKTEDGLQNPDIYITDFRELKIHDSEKSPFEMCRLHL